MLESVSAALSALAIDWPSMFIALGLLVLAAVLLVLEFFVVSFGLLLLVCLACVAGALFYAFAASELVGWVFVLVVPVLGFYVTRWGLARVKQSKLVTQAEVTAEAGYHHATDRINVHEGVVGEMLTAARPTGRARFEGGECDVQVRGQPLERGARIVVDKIDGPIVFVIAQSTEPGTG